jgi:GNAT superfamily N-acetyltransferase
VNPDLTLVPTRDRADLHEQARDLFDEHWPEYIFHDPDVAKWLPRSGELFPEWDFFVLDGERLLGACYGVPVAWDRTVADLPTGYTDTLRRAVTGHDERLAPDTFVVLGAVVRKDEAGRGVASRIVAALRDRAVAAGLGAVIAPVRPTTKKLYPLTDIDAFASWTREDGLPLDPWIRTHARLGATVLAGAPHSQNISGTCAEWEKWTAMALPATGDYVIPDGLAVLRVDREADTGTYHDPNVWMRHV